MKFAAELWTTVSGRELWATVFQDGPDAGSPCAFGGRQQMEAYASTLNAKKESRLAEKEKHHDAK